MFRCSIKPRSILFNLSFLSLSTETADAVYASSASRNGTFSTCSISFCSNFASVPVSDRQNDISDHLPECERISYI